MSPHFLTIPLEIRTQILKYLLPRDKFDITKDGWGVLRPYIALTAVNKQIRTEIIDAFNTTVPVDIRLEGHSWFRESWSLWGYLVRFNHPEYVEDAIVFNPDPISLRHGRKFTISLDVPIHWSRQYENEADLRPTSRAIEDMIGTLKFVDKITKLDVELTLKPNLYERLERPHDRSQNVEIVVSAARQYADLFKLKLANVIEASLTVTASSDCVDEGGLQLFHAKMEDYLSDWQKEVVQISG